MMNVVRFFLALVFTVLMIIPFAAIGLSVAFLFPTDQPGEMGALVGSNVAGFLYIVSPAIFVGCFRFQHTKWKRLLAVLKTIVVVAIVGIVWKVCTFTIFAKYLKDAPDVGIALDFMMVIILMFFSGIFTSRSLPIPNQPPLGPRPLTVRLFEYLFYAELCFGIIMTITGPDDIKDTIDELGKAQPELAAFVTPTLLTMGAVFGALTMLSVILLITRAGSVMMRNSFIAISIIGIASTIGSNLVDESIYQMSFGGQSALHNVLYFLGLIGNIFGIFLILSPSARAWINREQEDAVPQPV